MFCATTIIRLFDAIFFWIVPLTTLAGIHYSTQLIGAPQLFLPFKTGMEKFLYDKQVRNKLVPFAIDAAALKQELPIYIGRAFKLC